MVPGVARGSLCLRRLGRNVTIQIRCRSRAEVYFNRGLRNHEHFRVVKFRTNIWGKIISHAQIYTAASSSESLFLTFPTRLLTGQAAISSAGNGRNRSTGSRSGAAGSSQRP